MDPVVGAGVIGTALVNSSINILLGKLNTIVQENNQLRKDLTDDLRDIKYEMGMINEAVKKHAKSKENRGWIREVQELAYDIEDKIDEYTDRVTCSPKACWLERKFHEHKTKATRTEFAKEIQRLRKRAREAHERRNRYQPSSIDAQPSAGGPPESNPYIPEDELVGIDKPKKEVLKLLEGVGGVAAGDDEPASAARLQVISILGFRGIGKTTLANLVFKSQPRPRAWAVASECNGARGLLLKILSQFLAEEQIDAASSLEQLGENLRIHLESQKRYFIAIDDIQTQVWEQIKFSFPINTTGRIIVTTTILSIANDWISNGGYVYRMRPLNKDQAKELLMKEIFGSRVENREQFEEGSQIILKKCDGLPLALVNIAQHLKKPEQWRSNYCSKVCMNLSSHLQNKDSRLNKVLIHSFDNLPGHNLKTCLLSVSIFPEDHQISRKRLIRRWLAEGFVAKDDSKANLEDVASECFETLLDRSMIQPIHTGNNAAVKTCEVRGVLLDFIAHKSVSENFITFIHNNEPISNTDSTCAVRRVSLHNHSAGTGRITNIDLSRVRSLTVFGQVGGYINFGQCKLLRVLDLEKCTELKESDFRNIWRLMQLKYLSLRGTNVSEISKEISNLHHLETLDMRETNVMILPIEVFSLPRLAHLFGQFKLPCQLSKVREGSKLQKILSETCRLQTLAGFFIDGNHGFQPILLHVSKLRKVKVWSDGTPMTDSIDLLISSLQGRFYGNNALQALSIDFGDHSIDFLDSLKPPCLLTSVKLHGKLTKLPDFIKSLQDLELHLSSTSLGTECLLALESLKNLLYLKLVEDCEEFVNNSFSLRCDGFPSLQRLCIQAPKLPKLSIEDGAMRYLISLRLLCKDISGFAVDDIGHLKGLKEITLMGSELSGDSRKAWEKAAKKHPLLQIHGSLPLQNPISLSVPESNLAQNNQQ